MTEFERESWVRVYAAVVANPEIFKQVSRENMIVEKPVTVPQVAAGVANQCINSLREAKDK